MPTWPRAAPADAQRRLPECLLLAALLHALLVIWLGNAPGGSARPGHGVAGSLNVTLRGYERPSAQAATTTAPVPPQTGPSGTATQPRAGGQVRSPAQAARDDEGPGAARRGTWAPAPDAASPPAAIAPAPVRPADDAPPAPLPVPAAAAAPVPVPITPLPESPSPTLDPPPASPTAELPPLVASPPPPAQEQPLPAPPLPAMPAMPAPPPVPSPVAPVPIAPTPSPSRAAPVDVPPVRPLPEAAATSTTPPRVESARPVTATVEPAASPGPAVAPAGPDAGPLRGHDVATPPAPAASAPAPLNLQLARPRGGELSGRMTPGALPLLPRPPERPSKLAHDIENAARRDCRTAHAGMGLLAAAPLAADALSGSGCKW